MVTNKTRNIAIFSFVFLACSAGVLGFALYKINSLGDTLQQRTTVIANNAVLQQKYRELQKILAQTEEQRAEIKSHMLTEDATVQFLTDVEAFARSIGVTLTTKTLAVTPGKDGAFDTLSIEFSIEGSEAAIKNILRTLEDLPYHSQVTAVSLVHKNVASEGGGGFAGTVTLILTLR